VSLIRHKDRIRSFVFDPAVLPPPADGGGRGHSLDLDAPSNGCLKVHPILLMDSIFF
jgi:hypothetical protein